MTQKKKLSAAMVQCLRNAAAGRPLNDGFDGRSAHGGLALTLVALHKRGYLHDNQITAAGKAALQEGRS